MTEKGVKTEYIDEVKTGIYYIWALYENYGELPHRIMRYLYPRHKSNTYLECMNLGLNLTERGTLSARECRNLAEMLLAAAWLIDKEDAKGKEADQ